MPVCIDHHVTMVPQTHELDCWAAGAAMILGDHCVGAGTGRTFQGGLLPYFSNVENFASAAGLRILESYTTLSYHMLVAHLERGPIMLCGDVKERVKHCVVIVGATARILHVYDPSPMGVGTDGYTPFDQMMSQFPDLGRYVIGR